MKKSTIIRTALLMLMLAMGAGMQAQTAEFTYRKAEKSGLHLCEMKKRELVHRERMGMASNILYFAQIDCSGRGLKAGSIGIRLQSLSPIGELRKMIKAYQLDSLKQREDVSLSFTFDNGERLLFDSVYVSNQSTPMLADLVVIVDLLGVQSDVLGRMEMSALTHAYLVERFSSNNIVKMEMGGATLPFMQWQSAATLHDMFQTLCEKTGSDLYNPEALKKKKENADNGLPDNHQ